MSSNDGVSLLRGGSETPPPSLESQSSADLQLHHAPSLSGMALGPPPPYEVSVCSHIMNDFVCNLGHVLKESMPMYHPSPSVARGAAQLTEEEQVKIAKRMGLIQHLPTGTYDGCKKNRE